MKKEYYFLAIIWFILLPLEGKGDKVGSLFDKGYEQYVEKGYDAALANFVALIDIEKHSPAPRLAKIAMVHKLSGACYRHLKLYGYAIGEYQKALDIYMAQKNAPQSSNCLMQLGELFLMLSKPGQAIVFFEEAQVLFQSHNWLSKLQKSYFLLGKSYFLKAAYGQSKACFLKALSVNSDFGLSSANAYLFGDIHYYLAKIEYLEGNYGTAIGHLSKGKGFCEKDMGQIEGLKGLLIDIIVFHAEILLKTGAKEKFQEQLKNALQVVEGFGLDKQAPKIDLLSLKYCCKYGEFEKGGMIAKNYFSSEIPASPFGNAPKPHYLEFTKATCSLYQQEYETKKDIKHLKAKFAFIKNKLGEINSNNTKPPFLKDLNYINLQCKSLCDTALCTAISLFSITHNQAYLYEGLNFIGQFNHVDMYANNAWASMGQMDGDKTLLVKLATIENQVNGLLAKRLHAGTANNARPERELVLLLNKHEKIARKLLKAPHIKNRLFAPDGNAIHRLQEGLLENELYIKFYKVGESLFQFIISPEEITCNKISYDEVFSGHLAKYNDFIHESGSKNTSIDGIAGYVNSAVFLYKELFGHNGQLFKDKTIIIEKSKVFNNVSFDALLTGVPIIKGVDMVGFPFLIKRNNILHSGSVPLFLRHVDDRRNIKSAGYAGFAPFSGAKRGLGNSGTEVATAARILDGDSYLHGKATKAKLLKCANKHSILHLATHGLNHFLHPQLSSLAMYGSNGQSNLHYYQVLNRRWGSPLLILGACGSSHGEYIENYGTASLANAFQLAGVKSVIGANWQVSDHVSENIIGGLIHKIKDGEEVSRALYHAKLQMLKHPSEIYAHPHYWSVYTYQGVPQYIQTRTGKANWVLLSSFLLLLLVGAYFLKKFL